MEKKYRANIIILAAGRGTRLHAKDKPKVMYQVQGQPMIVRLAMMLTQAPEAARKIIIIGFKGQQIIDYLAKLGIRGIHFVWQKEQLGTAHAVRQALPLFKRSPHPTIIMNGDHPFLSRQTIQNLLLGYYRSPRPPAIIITRVKIQPSSSFGRIIQDRRGWVKQIIEAKNCTPDQLKIKFGNVGTYLFDTNWLVNNISKVKRDALSGEYYLTDLVSLAVNQGRRVLATQVAHPREALGINTPEDRARAEETKKTG